MMNANQSNQSPISVISCKVALALVTSLLLILSYPNFNQAWVAWIALLPLILVCRDQKPFHAFVLGLISGIGALLGIYYWMFGVPGFRLYHALPLSLYFAAYPALWCLVLSLLRGGGVSMIIMAPSLWVVLDYLKAHAGFMAFSWATLAHSQHTNIAGIQIAAFTGEYGVTFLVVMASVVLAEAVKEKKWKCITMVAALIALVHIFGYFVLSNTPGEEKQKVAVVQPSILRSERETDEGRERSLARLEDLTISAAASHPVLVVWPETAVRDLKKDSKLFTRLTSISQTINAPILTGASEFMKFPRKKESRDESITLDKYQYNSAYFITPDESPVVAPYRKRILVPFGEYLPTNSLFTWPSWLVPEVFKVLPGDGYKHFTLTEGIKVSPIICWEGLFADYVRLLAKEDTDVIVQVTNDNWFGRTAAPRQHNTASVLRAVENRIPILIASNTGSSQIVGPFGRIHAEVSELFTNGVIASEVPLTQFRTFYTRSGDIFVFLCIAFLAINIFGKIVLKYQRTKKYKPSYIRENPT